MYRLLGFNLDWLKVVIRMQVPQKIFILDAFVWEPHFYWSGVTCLVSSMQHEARWKITLLLAWIISRQGYLYYRHLNGNQRTVWDTCTSRLNVILIFPLYHFNSWRNSMFLYQISGGRRGGGATRLLWQLLLGYLDHEYIPSFRSLADHLQLDYVTKKLGQLMQPSLDLRNNR